MILLTDLFQMLAEGEFATLSLADKETGTIPHKHWEKVIKYLNRGIVEIHKRVNLFQREITLYALPTVEIYQLRIQRLATSVGRISEKTYFLKPDDFTGQLNIVEIKAVFDGDDNELFLNDRYQAVSFQQLAFDTLMVKGVTTQTPYQVSYQSYPDLIVMGDAFDLDTYVVNIPDTITEALLNYVASKVYRPTGTNDATANADKSNIYQSQYELAMAYLADLGLNLQDNDSPGGKFENQGWT